jgi:agmatine deiminase
VDKIDSRGQTFPGRSALPFRKAPPAPLDRFAPSSETPGVESRPVQNNKASDSQEPEIAARTENDAEAILMGRHSTWPSRTWKIPGEFEKQEAVWLSWPTYDHKKDTPVAPVMVELIKNLVPYVNVKIAVTGAGQSAEVEQLLDQHKIPMDNVKLFEIPHDEVWMRDFGPAFMVSDLGKVKVADFDFNFWGYETPASAASTKHEKIDRTIARQMGVECRPTRLVGENGDRESNGKGTMIAVESVELQRNPTMTRDEIEAELKDVFNLSTIIWLKKGVYEDDLTFRGTLPGPDGLKNAYTVITTGGHVDEFCRFVSPDRILLAEVSEEDAARDPIARENRERIEENYQILKNARDQDGKPFTITRIPMPVTMYDTMEPGDAVYDYISKLTYQDGSVFPEGKKVHVIPAASYLNFLISNDVVIAQKFWRPGMPENIRERDEKAQKILQEAFPERKVVPVDAMPVNLGGGGIHCITDQEPAP